ncbi:MAG: hypothetical protein ACYDIA_11100 [Candidatus Humimicrobiaceae bacterium]
MNNKEEVKIISNKILEMIYFLYQKSLSGKLNNLKPAYAVRNQTIEKSRFSIAKQASLFNKYENENK